MASITSLHNPVRQRPITDESEVWIDRAQVILSRCLEATWLTAIVCVPLVVLSEAHFTSFTELPKIALLRILAGIAGVLMLLQCALQAYDPRSTGWVIRRSESSALVSSSIRWATSRPLITAVALMTAVTGISALLSLWPAGSVWGVDQGRVGYDLYTQISYVVLFLAIALNLDGRSGAIRLVAAAAATGLFAAAIGLAQYFGQSPFGISSTYIYRWNFRVTGTAGSPLFYGALLTTLMPTISIIGMLMVSRWRQRARTWLLFVLVHFIVMFAMAITLSRGPWVGSTVALVIMLAILWFTTNRSTVRFVGSAILVAGLAAGIATSIPKESIASWSNPLQFAVSDTSEVIDSSQNIDELNRGLRRQSVNSRLTIWSTSVELSTERPVPPVGSDQPAFLRWIFGYGPDMFRFAYPLRAPGESLARLTSAAHNDVVNRLVELGILGVVVRLAVFGVAAAGIWRLTKRARSESDAVLAAFAAGLGALIAGWFVTQLSGIPQAGDTLVLWTSLGLLSALTWRRHYRSRSQSSSNQSARNASVLAGTTRVAAIGALWASIVVVAYVTFIQNVNPLRADAMARQAFELRASDREASAELYGLASRLAPRHQSYLHHKGAVLGEAAEYAASPLQAADLRARAYTSEKEAYEVNPLSREAHFRLAEAAWELASLGSAQHAAETLLLYEQLALLAPEHPLVIERLPLIRQALESG